MDILLRLQFDEYTASDLLNVLARHNARLMRRHPTLPLLYDSGTQYQREKSELWMDVIHMYQRGVEDCDALSAARAGELIARGWQALRPGDGGYEVARRTRPASIPAEAMLVTKSEPGRPGAYHCITRYQVGGTWYRDDPSARLGMYDGRRERGNYPYGTRSETQLRRVGVIPEDDPMSEQIVREVYEEARLAGRLEFGAALDDFMADQAESEADFGDAEDRKKRRAERFRRRARRRRNRAKNKRGRAKLAMKKANKLDPKRKRKGKDKAPLRPSVPPPPDMMYEDSLQSSPFLRPGRQLHQSAQQRWISRHGNPGVPFNDYAPPSWSSDSSWESSSLSDLDRSWNSMPDAFDEVVDEEVLEGIAMEGRFQGLLEGANEALVVMTEGFAGDLDDGAPEFGFIRKMVESIKARRAERQGIRDGRKQNRKLRRALRKAKRKDRQHERDEKAAAKLQEQQQELQAAYTAQTGLPAPALTPGASAAAPGVPVAPGVPGAATAPGMAPMAQLQAVTQGVSMQTDRSVSAFALPLAPGLVLVQTAPPGAITNHTVNQYAAQARLNARQLLAAG